ncbi:DUF4127 family protein [bacterium]|nr:DUF4127 family protein [bacterium]
MKRIAMIPIDNRPVCYQLPKMTASIDKDIELILPPRNLLGGLKTSSQIVSLFDWLRRLENIDALIIALDTIAYGGLVNSRRCPESFEDILARVNTFLDIVKKKNIKVYAFSSIMRISNNNINEEEKFYWDTYGKKLFDYSFNLHKSQITKENEAHSKYTCIERTIPDEILYDYIKTRKRNYDINLYYLEKQKQGLFKKLIFSMDDCAKYGFNVKEANCIKLKGGIVKTGADEIPLTLMTYAMYEDSPKKPKIFIDYASPATFHKISKYEDISVRECCIQQIRTAGGIIAEKEADADIIMHVNNFEQEQGDLMLGSAAKSNVKKMAYLKPYFVADIVNANGADNNFISKNIDMFNSLLFLGYAGWNTTGNTLGSAISAAITKYMAGSYSEKDFQKLQIVRLLDDWAYQANVRKKLKDEIKSLDLSYLNMEMESYINKVKKLFHYNGEIKCSYPWSRYFETEITLK